MSRLYFAAKAPLAGQVKTRLGATIGMQAAATLYEGFLRDLAARFAHARFQVAWHIAPGSWPHLEPIIGRRASVRSQRGNGWAERQANLFRDCHVAGEGGVVLAATDSPQLAPRAVEEAFAGLEGHDIVVGPTHDGGYYLVGMNGFHDIFEPISMGTASALDVTLACARSQRLSTFVLASEFDVDTEQDLDLLAEEVRQRSDLSSTAAALALIRGSGVCVA